MTALIEYLYGYSEQSESLETAKEKVESESSSDEIEIRWEPEGNRIVGREHFRGTGGIANTFTGGFVAAISPLS